MVPPRIHLVGNWAERQVSAAWVDSSFRPPAEALATIESSWQAALGVPGRTLFDGPMCRLESWEASPDQIRLRVSRTGYKSFWCTNMSNPAWADQFGPSAMANPLGVSAALETADGFLLFGRRSGRVAYYPNRVHPFAGCVEPSPDGSPPSLFDAVYRELGEELGIARSEIELIRLIGMIEDPALRQAEVVFRVKSSLTRSAIESRLDQAEHTSIESIAATQPQLMRWIDDTSLTPVARGTLSLWSRAVLGDNLLPTP